MARIYMVRHGRAAAGFGGAMDPGLDEAGRAQAAAAAKTLAPRGPLKILTSPLLRTRETAAPLAELWQRTPVVEEAVAEIPSPEGMTLEQRAVWLKTLMTGSWRDVNLRLGQWREDVIAALMAQPEDCVIFSHYVAINVAAGAALGDDRIHVFAPDNCSVTLFEAKGGALELIEKGRETAQTKVN